MADPHLQAAGDLADVGSVQGDELAAAVHQGNGGHAIRRGGCEESSWQPAREWQLS